MVDETLGDMVRDMEELVPNLPDSPVKRRVERKLAERRGEHYQVKSFLLDLESQPQSIELFMRDGEERRRRGGVTPDPKCCGFDARWYEGINVRGIGICHFKPSKWMRR